MLQHFALQPTEISKRYNAVPVKDNCALFALAFYFEAQAIRWCRLNFFPADLCCHGNELWDKLSITRPPWKTTVCCLYLPLIFGSWLSDGVVKFFSRADPCCHGNEFLDKIDYNLARMKDNCVLFAPIPVFRAQAIRWCHLNFSLADPYCHDIEFWNKMGHNAAPLKDNCALFAPTLYFQARLSDGAI